MSNCSIVVFIVMFLSVCPQSIQLYGQQEQQTSQYQQLKYMLNPAYGGLDYSLSVDAVIRSQWTGLERAPRFQYLGFNIPTYALSGAMGGEIARYTEGALSHIKLTGSYNYVSSMSFGFLSFGGRLGVINTRLDGQNLRTSDGVYDDGLFDHQDALLPNDRASSYAPYVHLGAFVYNNSLQSGLSLSRIPNYQQRLSNAGIDHTLHINLFAQYDVQYSDFLTFLPSILLKSDFNSFQTDVSLHTCINGNIFGGIGIRGYSSNSLDAIIFSAGLNLGENYRLSYSYDAGISGLRRVNEGSHEIHLNYNLRKLIGAGVPPKVEYNPRNL